MRMSTMFIPVRDSEILRELTETGGVDVAAMMNFVCEPDEMDVKASTSGSVRINSDYVQVKLILD